MSLKRAIEAWATSIEPNMDSIVKSIPLHAFAQAESVRDADIGLVILDHWPIDPNGECRDQSSWYVDGFCKSPFIRVLKTKVHYSQCKRLFAPIVGVRAKAALGEKALAKLIKARKIVEQIHAA